MHRSIQGWEIFYIEWIRRKNIISVLYLEDFVGSFFKSRLKELLNLLNVEWSEQRLNCMQKYNEDRVRRKETRLDKHPLYNQTSNKIVASSINSCTSNEIYSFDIYNKRQFIWMKSAIRRVIRELEKHDFDSAPLSNYKDENLKIYVCPDT